MSPLPRPLNVSALLLAFCLPGFSQQVSGLVAMPRDGQTFLTWNEVAISGTSYRVYRSPVPITNEAQLQAADLLGEVDDLSSWNQRRSIAEEANHNWIIVPGGPELSNTTGLFVAAIEVAGNSWFAVTTLQGGTEDRTIVLGENTTTSPTQENPAPVEAVLQAATSDTEIWAHWTSDRDTSHTQHQSLWPSRGHNFRVSKGSAPGPHGLLLRLHAKGGHYFSAWPHYPEVPEDVDILSLDGPVRGPEPSRKWYTVFSFGARESFPAPPTPGEVIDTFALKRCFWSLNWTQNHLGSSSDSGRVYLAGSSAGAMGSMILASEHPDRFAAILCRKGLFDFTVQDIQNTGYPEELFGPITWNLYTDTGIPVFERLDATTVSQFNPSAKWPFIRTINGRYDPVMGWASAWNLFDGLLTAGRPACHYFDESQHGPNGYWVENLQDELVRRTFDHRSDLPSLRFSDFSLDSDPGNGNSTLGNPIGNLGGGIEFNPASCTETQWQLAFEVSLRAEGAADDAPRPAARARMTPKPSGDFQLGPDEFLRYTLRDAGELLDEHLLFPDSQGLFTTPPAPFHARPRMARFHIMTLPDLPALFVGDSPLVGEKAQAVIFGEVDEMWTLAWSFHEGWWETPWGIFELGAPWTIARTGQLGEMGVNSFFLDIQDLPWLAGRTVHFQALVDDSLTDTVTVTLR